MARRKAYDDPGPYAQYEHISHQTEIPFGNGIIKQGDLIKFKQIRGIFKFKYLVHNKALDRTWIDCTDSLTGEYRSFYIHLLKGPVHVKRSFRKKAI